MKILLQKYMIGLKMTQTQLAYRVGVSKMHISKIENDKCIPSIDLLIRIADVFDICPLDLIDFCDDCKKTHRKCCKKHFI